MLQQTAPATIVWQEPVAPPPAVVPASLPSLPDWARADPLGYERSECSPLIRAASETMEACQARVRAAVAAHLQTDAEGALEDCRRTSAGDRYALQCGTPSRPDRPTSLLSSRTCETRPQLRPGGGVAWTETCRQDEGRPDERDGLELRLGGQD